MRIVQQRERVNRVEYRLGFDLLSDRNCGLSFECDKDGRIDFTALHQCALANLDSAINGDKYSIPVSKLTAIRAASPPLGSVECGELVSLDGFTNTCQRCNRDYNMSGQLLAPRSHWGEETGESLSDILSGGFID